MNRLLLLAITVLVVLLFYPVAVGISQTNPGTGIFLPLIVHQPVTLVPTPTPAATSTVAPPATITPTSTPTPITIYNCSFDKYNCDDFDTQPRAQVVFDYCIAVGAGDIHQLDQDNDNVACESLPPLVWWK